MITLVKDTIDKYGYIELNLREKFNIFILLKIIFKLKKINIHEYTLEFIKSFGFFLCGWGLK